MTRIRVLVADGGVTVRRLLAEALGDEDDLEVVATAPNGSIALAKLSQVNPDVVVLDVDDDLATLVAIRAERPHLPVVIFSALTSPGSAATVAALVRGASDYLAKPCDVTDARALRDVVRTQLAPKIRAAAEAALQRCGSPPATVAPSLAAEGAGRRQATDGGSPPPVAVVIGVSTGGPQALPALIARLPRDLGVPVLMVQHMPPMFTALLAESLSKLGGIPVREAAHGDVVEPGQVWLAPGDRHMMVELQGNGPVLSLAQGPPENSCRPSVDVLFRSAAKVYGRQLLGVVLTGMGRDGLRGAREIVEAGGRVIAQDAASSVVWGMPGAVAAAGLADTVLDLGDIADAIVRRVGPQPRLTQPVAEKR